MSGNVDRPAEGRRNPGRRPGRDPRNPGAETETDRPKADEIPAEGRAANGGKKIRHNDRPSGSEERKGREGGVGTRRAPPEERPTPTPPERRGGLTGRRNREAGGGTPRPGEGGGEAPPAADRTTTDNRKRTPGRRRGGRNWGGEGRRPKATGPWGAWPGREAGGEPPSEHRPPQSRATPGDGAGRSEPCRRR